MTTFYDANDNVVRVDIQNVDETGAVQPNSPLHTRCASTTCWTISFG